MAVTTKELREYYQKRNTFYVQEKKNTPWMLLGVLLFIVITSTGSLILPIAQLLTWAIISLIGSIVVFTGLFSIWWEQRKFDTFERWKKYYGEATPDAER